MKGSNVFDRWNLKWFQPVGVWDGACLCVPFSGARTMPYESWRYGS